MVKEYFKTDKIDTGNTSWSSPDINSVFTSSEKRKEYFDLMLMSSGTPGYTSPSANSFRGFNPFGIGPAMMNLNDSVIGLTFITRPHLNLSDQNVYRSEKLISLANAGANDLGGFIRGLLDPTWANKQFGVDGHPMLDNALPFISCLNEYLKTSTGFSDLALKITASEPGIRQQVYQSVNSKLEDNGQFTIQQTYHSPKPLLIQTIFQHWLNYISEVKSGDNKVSPHLEYLIKNRCDHDCRIYHLLMNADYEYVESMFATVQSIPETFPLGAVADIDKTQNTLRAQGQDEFSMQYRSIGVRFDELSLVNAFNEHTFLFNRDLMLDFINDTSTKYRQLNISEYHAYRYMVYPLLKVMERDARTSNGKEQIRQGIKLTWWVRRD